MAYQKLQGDQLFNGYQFLDASKVLIIEEDGTIVDIVPRSEAGSDVQKFRGIISPGFINCHCHLELSHLKNVIPPHTGLIEFLCSVVTKRGFDPAVIQKEIESAEEEMYENGIVAVGDIGNTADTAGVKSNSNIWWQNFVEVLGFTDEKADDNIAHYTSIANELKTALQHSSARNRTVLVPHAPYTISPKTFQLINQATGQQIISLHNQEHPAEDVLYKTGGGEYLKLFKIFGVETSPFPVTGESSIRSCLPHFNNGQTIFLVHNTFMPEEDIVWANKYAKENNLKLVYCLCPNANLYIENKVPPVELLMKHQCHLVLGTDSYSSNWQLNIAKEVGAIRKHFPNVPFETVLQWATSNGAAALQWNDELGSFEKGKKPGVIAIDEKNWDAQRLF